MDNRIAKRSVSRLATIFRSKQNDGFGYTAPRHRGRTIVVCLFLSFLLWFFFSMRRATFLDLTLPTRVVNLPPGVALATPPPASVAYRVRGDGLALLPLYYNRPVVDIDASQPEVNFELNGAVFPGDVRVESASPTAYVLQLEPSMVARVPIRLVADITTAPTHEFIDFPRVDPDSVTVSGARTVVSRISSWPTDPIRITGFRDTLDADLALSDSLAGIVTLDRTETHITAVADAFTQGTRKIQVRLTGAPNKNILASLDPEIVTVTYKVRVADYNRAQASSEFYATVPFDLVRGDTTGKVVPTVNLPRGLLIRDVEMDPPGLRYYNYIE